jgi:integrase
VLAHLSEAVRPAATFAYITGWRIDSEVLSLEWRQVDFTAGEVRLDPGRTKNGEGRTFPMTRELRQLLEAQRAITDDLQRSRTSSAGTCSIAMGGPSGAPGRVSDGVRASGMSWACAARLATHGRSQSRPRAHSRARRDADDRAQDSERV